MQAGLYRVSLINEGVTKSHTTDQRFLSDEYTVESPPERFAGSYTSILVMFESWKEHTQK